MLALSDKDVAGMWMVVSGKAALFSAPVVGAALLTHLISGACSLDCVCLAPPVGLRGALYRAALASQTKDACCWLAVSCC